MARAHALARIHGIARGHAGGVVVRHDLRLSKHATFSGAVAENGDVGPRTWPFPPPMLAFRCFQSLESTLRPWRKGPARR